MNLEPLQARHLRTVLRLRPGDAVEAFDDAGHTAPAVVTAATPEKVTIRIERVVDAPLAEFAWTIAAALPKGQRADWMVEKLAELGTAVFVPLITERSVTHPAGREKTARWARLASEASRQSGRAGVMRIEPLTPLAQFIAGRDNLRHLSPPPESQPITQMIVEKRPTTLTMLIGPEGGWTAEELTTLAARGSIAVRLAQSVLRVETAAVAAAAIAAAWAANHQS